MFRSRLVTLLALALVLTACSGPTALPDPTPEPVDQLQPTLPAAAPDNDVVSATPLPPEAGLDPQLYAPQPGDERLQRDQVYLDGSQLVVAESFPPQYFLSLAGSLPTPCHALRITTALQAAEGRILVDAYALTDPNTACMQVLEPLNVNVPLGSLAAGKYEVWLNGQPVGEIEAP